MADARRWWDRLHVRTNRGTPEAAAGPWRVEPVEAVTDTFAAAHMGVEEGPERPLVVAIDGRSDSGRAAVAQTLRAHVPDSVIVHTEDFAWHPAFFGWADVMRKGVLEPLYRGEAVHYRPLAKDEREGDGVVTIGEGCPAVFIEGVGAARSELMHWIDAVVWVQSDPAPASEAPATTTGPPSGAGHAREGWKAEEDRFLADQRPWERADVIVAGDTGPLPHDPATELVVAPPLGRDAAE